jgi:hypothetical protein
VDDHRFTRLTPKADIVCRRLGDSAVLIDLETNGIFELNRTGFRVWELLHDGLTIDAMVHRLQAEFGVERLRATAEVETLLARLREERLVVEGG